MGEPKEPKREAKEKLLQALQENRNRVIGAAAALAVLIVILAGALSGSGTRQTSLGISEETESEAAAEEETGASESESAGESAAVALEENAYPQITALMESYYRAAAEGDVETLQSVADSLSEDMLIYLQKRSEYIESYQDLTCYTKAGPVEDSFVVYVSYEVKFRDVDALVPGISPFLVYGREDGSYYIYEGEVEEAVNAYLEEVSAQDDVVDLMNLVQVKFNEAVTADEDLSDFLARMTEELKVEVGEALADAQASEEAETAEPDGTLIRPGEVRATEVVNVRASDSEQADRIGKLQTGDVLEALESRANGWTKVNYNGKEGFVKSEYLEPVGEDLENAGEGDVSGTDGGEDAGASAALPASGTVMVAETVNVRKSPDEKAERIGVCYQGGRLEILMQQADGWTKVKFEGKTGYVKTAVLKIVK